MPKQPNNDNLLRMQREKIDAIDSTIVDLLNQRAQCARRIGEMKGSGPVYRPEREIQVLHHVQAMNKGPLSNRHIICLFREIMSSCLALERPLTVVYLGSEGTLSEFAAIKHFGQAAGRQTCTSIENAVSLVETNQADYIVVPIEGQIIGEKDCPLDFLFNTPLKITGEVVLPVQQSLLRKIVGLKGVRCVYLTAQSLAQTHQWLTKNLPGIPYISVPSYVEAARLASLDTAAVAITHNITAEYFGLITLIPCVENEAYHTVYFYVLGREAVNPSGQDKTTLILYPDNKPDALHSMMVRLEQHHINIIRLKAHPLRSDLAKYAFLVELEGHQSEVTLQLALKELVSEVNLIKVLGSYPCAVL